VIALAFTLSVPRILLSIFRSHTCRLFEGSRYPLNESRNFLSAFVEGSMELQSDLIRSDCPKSQFLQVSAVPALNGH
jgi:hypothetical protein